MGLPLELQTGWVVTSFEARSVAGLLQGAQLGKAVWFLVEWDYPWTNVHVRFHAYGFLSGQDGLWTMANKTHIKDVLFGHFTGITPVHFLWHLAIRISRKSWEE